MQEGSLCGVHCINTLLQGPFFGPVEMSQVHWYTSIYWYHFPCAEIDHRFIAAQHKSPHASLIAALSSWEYQRELMLGLARSLD